MKNEFADIPQLLKRRLLRDEDPPTLRLIREMRHVRRRGFFTKDEFIRMCRWKSPRPQRFYEANAEAEVIDASREVFAAGCERRRIELLTSLKGVSVPTASAILTLTNPRSYGVIDIRVWQLLYRYGCVNVKPAGTNFSFDNWSDYLRKLRYWADELGVGARVVERTLFEYHRETQGGVLYKRSNVKRPASQRVAQ
ncbi:MAG: hypothetical protein M3268_01040 [Acidobacteriota bacterium]|nr:hypothetical protein [Acidobacteriota bacterium]